MGLSLNLNGRPVLSQPCGGGGPSPCCLRGSGGGVRAPAGRSWRQLRTETDWIACLLADRKLDFTEDRSDPNEGTMRLHGAGGTKRDVRNSGGGHGERHRLRHGVKA